MPNYQPYNANPKNRRTDDCAIRAIAVALGEDWYKIFVDLAIQGLRMADTMSSNAVWGAYLRDRGFVREVIPAECVDCYTVHRFCEEHPEGTYLMAISGHLCTVKDGILYDTWDSSDEIPVYYWHKKER